LRSAGWVSVRSAGCVSLRGAGLVSAFNGPVRATSVPGSGAPGVERSIAAGRCIAMGALAAVRARISRFSRATSPALAGWRAGDRAIIVSTSALTAGGTSRVSACTGSIAPPVPEHRPP
jgi:hypothetical protein